MRMCVFVSCQAGGRRKARIRVYTRDTPDNIWHLVNERKGGAPGLFLPVLKQRAFVAASLFAAPYLDSQTKEMSVEEPRFFI